MANNVKAEISKEDDGFYLALGSGSKYGPFSSERKALTSLLEAIEREVGANMEIEVFDMEVTQDE